jgi:hypothetical protein
MGTLSIDDDRRVASAEGRFLDCQLPSEIADCRVRLASANRPAGNLNRHSAIEKSATANRQTAIDAVVRLRHTESQNRTPEVRAENPAAFSGLNCINSPESRGTVRARTRPHGNRNPA